MSKFRRKHLGTLIVDNEELKMTKQGAFTILKNKQFSDKDFVIGYSYQDLYPEGMINSRIHEKEGLKMNKCKTCAHNLVCCHLSDYHSDFYAYHGYHYDFENCPHYKDNDNSPIRFILNGCDIFFKAVAPADITLKQLLKQCDRIKPDYCACGIKSDDMPSFPVELTIMYDSITKVDEGAECTVLPEVSK